MNECDCTKNSICFPHMIEFAKYAEGVFGPEFNLELAELPAVQLEIEIRTWRGGIWEDQL